MEIIFVQYTVRHVAGNEAATEGTGHYVGQYMKWEYSLQKLRNFIKCVMGIYAA